MAYNAALGFDPDKDYSAILSNTNISTAERAQAEKERAAKINKMYGGVEPTLAGSTMTYSQAYDVTTGQKKDATPAFSSTSQTTTVTAPRIPTVGVSSSAGDGLKYYENTMTDDGSRVDYSKLISNGILSGASAGEIQTYLNLRNQMIAANPSLAKYANDSITQAAEKYIAEHQNDSNTLIDNLKGIYSGNNSTYAQALAQANKITDASVERAINDLAAQKGSTNQSYADLFRQLYRDKMMSQKNINQRLASQGITGGMSESSQLGLETSYADALRQGEQERINTLSALDKAITDTRLTGDTAKAQSALDYAIKSADSYAGILQALLNRNDTLEYNKAALEREQTASEKAAAREMAFTIMQNGGTVSPELLEVAGISQADADSLLAAVKESQNKASTPTMSASNALSAVKGGYIDDSIISALLNAGYSNEYIQKLYEDGAIATGTPDGWNFYIINNGLADANNQISPDTWNALVENGATEDMLRGLGYTIKPHLGQYAQAVLNQTLRDVQANGGTLSPQQIANLEWYVEKKQITEEELDMILDMLGAA